MKSSEVWARVRRRGAHGLRRGAWYPVVNEVRDDLVLVDVARRNVPIPRALVEVSDERPSRWSVVRWDPSEAGAKRLSTDGHAMIYAVCPECRSRTNFDEAKPQRMTCSDCGGEFEVDWDHPC